MCYLTAKYSARGKQLLQALTSLFHPLCSFCCVITALVILCSSHSMCVCVCHCVCVHGTGILARLGTLTRLLFYSLLASDYTQHSTTHTHSTTVEWWSVMYLPLTDGDRELAKDGRKRGKMGEERMVRSYTGVWGGAEIEESNDCV